MQAKREGRPQRAADELPTRNGLRRFPIELPLDMVVRLDRLADEEKRSRVMQIRVMLELGLRLLEKS